MQWHSEESERAEISVKALLDNPAVTPPTRLFFLLGCARAGAAVIGACARALHLARLPCLKIMLQLLAILCQTGWECEKNTYKERSVFFSSQRWQANTTEAKITSAIGAVCVGKTSYELWIIPRTSHWNHELGDRAMGESWCTCNVCSRFIIECVRITVLRINTRVTMRSTPLFSAKNDV